MNLDQLQDSEVKQAAGELAKLAPDMLAGTRMAGEVGCWGIFSMEIDQILQRIAGLADQQKDASVLVRLLQAMVIPQQSIPRHGVTAAERSRLAAAQLYTVSRDLKGYEDLAERIRVLDTQETTLLGKARNPNLLQSVDNPGSYLGRHRYIQTVSGETAKIGAHHEDWYLNQALLREALGRGLSPELESRLVVIMLQGFNKAAKVNEGQALGYTTSPFSDETEDPARWSAPFYHRSTNNQLLARCTVAVGEQMESEIGGEWCPPQLIHNPTFIEVIQRAFGAGVKLGKVREESDFRRAIDILLQQALQGKSPNHYIAVDVSALFPRNKKSLGARLEAVFREQVEVFLEGFRQQASSIAAKKAFDGFDEGRVREIIQDLRSRLFAVVCTTYAPHERVPRVLGKGIDEAEEAPKIQRIESCPTESTSRAEIWPRLLPLPEGRSARERFRNPHVDVLLMPRDFSGNYRTSSRIRLEVEQALTNSGYRLDPLQTKRVWAGVKSYEEILSDASVELTRLATSGKSIPEVFDSWGDFLRHHVVTSFEGFAGDKRPYVGVLVEATMLLLKGLGEYEHKDVIAFQATVVEKGPKASYQGVVEILPRNPELRVFLDPALTKPVYELSADTLRRSVSLYVERVPEQDANLRLRLRPGKGRLKIHRATRESIGGAPGGGKGSSGVDAAYRQMGLGPLLSASYFRILNAMAAGAQARGDLVDFLNQIEVVHQEVASILTLIEPHQRDGFQDAFNGFLARKRSIPGDLLPGKVHLKPSAMHCLASVAAGVEEQLGSQRLKVLFLKDCYYEESNALDSWKSWDTFVLSGDDLSIKIEGTGLCLETTPSGDKAWDAVRHLNLFICDFHHNVSATRTTYRTEDLARYVELLYEKGLVGAEFTVAIDCTIDLLDSREVKVFLEACKDKILEGRLNVALFRSAQKFDMLGMDNFYGGFSISFNKAGVWNRFNDRMDDSRDQLEGANRQGLTHLMKYAAGSLDRYRRAIMRNTRILYRAIPDRCKARSTNPGHLVVSRIKDRRIVFLDIKLPRAKGRDVFLEDLACKLQALFQRFGMANQIPFTTRASFGFPTTNLVPIVGAQLRLTPGLDEENVMLTLAKFIDQVYGYLDTYGLRESADPKDYTKSLGSALDAFDVASEEVALQPPGGVE